MIPLETIFRNPSSILTPLHQAWPSVMDAKKPARWRWLLACAERPRVLAPLVISKGGRLTSQKPARCRGLAFFCAPSARLKQAWPSVMDAKKPARWRWLLACAERPRFELGDQKNRSQLSRLLHYHSATSPRNSASGVALLRLAGGQK